MTKKQTLSKEEASQAAKALEVLFTTEYISKRELYKSNFIRGIFFSAGSIIGATIILGVGLWGLSLFKEIPLVGPVTETIKESIQQSQN